MVLVGLTATAGAASSPLGLSRGRGPVATGSERWTAERCGRCHVEQLEQWQESRHRVAHTNDLYQAGLVAETSAFCVHCHSPLVEQTAEVLDNLGWYRWQDPRHRRGGPPPRRLAEPFAAEGVTCAVCHVRDDVVLVARPQTGPVPHPVRVEPQLTSSALCGGCHEFGMPTFERGEFTVSDVPMQSTLSEWEDWVDNGGQGTCQSCHMPAGHHGFAGAHDREALAAALDVRVRRRGTRLVWTLESVGVGHDLPTGDLFRAITLETGPSEHGPWLEVHRAGRTFEVVEGPSGVRKVPATDTRLRPAEQRQVQVEAPRGTWWRVVYHYGSPNDEARGVLGDDVLYAVLASGRR